MHKKLLILAVLFVAVSMSAQTTVVCESQNGRMNQCDVGTGFVTMAHQLSDASCTQGTSWGYNAGKIWVSNGCRAEFNVVPRALVSCESVNGQLGRCVADTTEGVRLWSRASNSGCEFGRDWGWDTSGIWVTNGCSAQFAVRPAQSVALVTTGTPATMISAGGQPATILCESKNNTRNHCRTDTRWGVTLVRQVSDNACVRGRSWGYDKDGIWVDEGCRGEFTLGDAGTAVVTQNVIVAAPPTVVTSSTPGVVAVPAQGRMPTVICESTDGKRNHCDANTMYGVRMLRQISDKDCQLNSTWGVDGNGIWVTNGCRAEFALGEAQSNMTVGGDSMTVRCESKNGQRTVCPADTRMGVAVVHQLSDSDCRLNSTWGFDANGIWVTSGCRAEFILRR